MNITGYIVHLKGDDQVFGFRWTIVEAIRLAREVIQMYHHECTLDDFSFSRVIVLTIETIEVTMEEKENERERIISL